MLRRSLLVFFSFVISSLAFSHSTKEAHFRISKESKFIVVEADFSWAIKNAVVKEFPKLESAENKAEVIEGLKKYLANHFILINAKGKKLDLFELEEITKKFEGHENRFRLKYDLGDLKIIKNSIQFNIYNDQINYHKLVWEAEEYNFITSLDHAEYEVPSKSSNFFLWLLAFLLVGLIGIIFYQRLIFS